MSIESANCGSGATTGDRDGGMELEPLSQGADLLEAEESGDGTTGVASVVHSVKMTNSQQKFRAKKTHKQVSDELRG